MGRQQRHIQKLKKRIERKTLDILAEKQALMNIYNMNICSQSKKYGSK